jgi:hypothetical protein
LDEGMREPGMWAAVLRTLDYRGRTVQSVLEEPAAYQAFTAEQVKSAFNKYYQPARAVRVCR